jgi:hypothetical protein
MKKRVEMFAQTARRFPPLEVGRRILPPNDDYVRFMLRSVSNARRDSDVKVIETKGASAKKPLFL